MNPLSGEPEAEALVTDRYLDAILAAHERGADDAPADLAVDPQVRLAARRLSTDLVRVHPSFRFEDRLAARLAQTAAGMRLDAAGGEGMVVPVAFGLGDPALGLGDPAPRLGEPAPRLGGPALGSGTLHVAGPARAGGPVPRPLLIGVTSAAISLAGAAYVAWRRGRVPLAPMARAVRAANEARLAGSRGRAG